MSKAVGGAIRCIGISREWDGRYSVWTNRTKVNHCDGLYITEEAAKRQAELVGATQHETEFEWRLGMYLPKSET